MSHSSESTAPGPTAGAEDRGLHRLFVLIILTEAVVIAALFWFGRHFS